jgi:two-component system sensor histidine kinase UhpB
MSLKLRLVLSIAISFALALLLGGALATLRAQRSVQTEMQAALQSGADVVADLSKIGPSDLEHVVHRFNGMRHLRATLKNESGQIVVATEPARPSGEAPRWFEYWIAPLPSSLPIAGPPLPSGWSLRLTTDPRNEIAEVWGQTRDAFMVMFVFCVGAGVLVYLLAVQFLGFLGGFGRALGAVAEGHYDTQLPETGPPEFARLARDYNRMAFRLSQYEQENRNLQKQIGDIQEDERAEIARDLHDEVGPLLFSINVDATAIPDLAQARDVEGVKERISRIEDATSRIQQSVKDILRQLKPIDVLDFGLDTAVRELFSFWEARTPNLHLEFDNALGEAALTREQVEALYRVVQESLSNAIRHGRPKSILVTAQTASSGDLVVSIKDDGSGLPVSRSIGGEGINGMGQRLRNLGGRLVVENNKIGGGVTVIAAMPLSGAGHGIA